MGLLVVLYSINVFITFVLSQTGMVRHWWKVRDEVRDWLKRLLINGVGLVLTGFILVSMVGLKFHEGGWITLVVTGGLVIVALLIRRHYGKVLATLRRLDGLVTVAQREIARPTSHQPKFVPSGRAAVLLVNGFNGLGLHALLNLIRLFGGAFENYIFLQVGVVDAGSFKGAKEVQELQRRVDEDLHLYVEYMRVNGIYAEARSAVGVDLVEEITKLAEQIRCQFPGVVFFGGQLVFMRDSFANRLLHNNIVFAVQRSLYLLGVPFVVLPVRL